MARSWPLFGHRVELAMSDPCESHWTPSWPGPFAPTSPGRALPRLLPVDPLVAISPCA